ncbi:hypothetical protein DPSP01_013538 [Paraphaeosphaeria sporulosa]
MKLLKIFVAFLISILAVAVALSFPHRISPLPILLILYTTITTPLSRTGPTMFLDVTIAIYCRFCTCYPLWFFLVYTLWTRWLSEQRMAGGEQRRAPRQRAGSRPARSNRSHVTAQGGQSDAQSPSAAPRETTSAVTRGQDRDVDMPDVDVEDADMPDADVDAPATAEEDHEAESSARLAAVSRGGAGVAGREQDLQFRLPASSFSARAQLPSLFAGPTLLKDACTLSETASSSAPDADAQSTSFSAPSTAQTAAADLALIKIPRNVGPRLLASRKRARDATSVPPGSPSRTSSSSSQLTATRSSTAAASTISTAESIETALPPAADTALVLYQFRLNMPGSDFNPEHEPAAKRLCTDRNSTAGSRAPFVRKSTNVHGC